MSNKTKSDNNKPQTIVCHAKETSLKQKSSNGVHFKWGLFSLLINAIEHNKKDDGCTFYQNRLRSPLKKGMDVFLRTCRHKAEFNILVVLKFLIS